MRKQRGFLLYPARFRGGGGGGADPYFPNVSILLHMDGANGSKAFPDSSASPKIVTPGGNAKISTSQYVFGGASADFDGAGDYLSSPSGSAFQFPGDFTVEFWARATAFKGSDILYDGRASGGSPTGFAIYLAGGGALSVYSGGLVIAGASVGLNVWRHIALCRSGTSTRLFIDGTQSGATWNTAANFSDGRFLAGIDSNLSAGSFQGSIDELRVTKGVARYTANFTPPNTPFPSS